MKKVMLKVLWNMKRAMAINFTETVVNVNSKFQLPIPSAIFHLFYRMTHTHIYIYIPIFRNYSTELSIDVHEIKYLTGKFNSL